jgi:hypothetical protein
MISTDNKPLNLSTQDDDFTVEHYRQLLRLAKTGWKIATYENICWTKDFILWRHDVDYSLNRSLALAQIESEESVKATYFVNPHSEFYNLAEAVQYEKLIKILSLGHDLGLHFDASFYDVESEKTLDTLVAQEASYLQDLFGQKPVAFSFHNPVAAHLTCEAEEYGGLVNCYSRRFKTEVAYCSDSNGYWRFRRLYDALKEKKDARLQVLTHPGWWQEKPMPPRQRIFRSAYGRASKTMQAYDDGLESHARVNQAGPAAALRVFKESQPRLYDLCDYLWNTSAFQTLFVELWRLHEAQINRLCKAYMRKGWRIPATEVNAFFDSDGVSVDGWRLFQAVFGVKWQDACGFAEDEHKAWVGVRNQLIHARSSIHPAELEQGCVYLCEVLQKIGDWGLSQSFAYDGLAHLGSVGLPTHKTAEGRLEENISDRLDELPKHLVKQWREFLLRLSESN